MIILKLKEINYSGQNIGSELKFNFTVGTKKTSLDLKIKKGETRPLEHVLMHLENFSDVSDLSITISATEKDIVFDDTGTSTKSFNINFKESSEQTFEMGVDVVGQGGDKGKKAFFTLKFFAELETGIRCVSDGDPGGWLKVLLENGEEVPLPYQLELELIKKENNREYFLIKEGFFRGKKASVRLKTPDGDSFLTKEKIRSGAARLVFEKNARKLNIEGLGVFNAKTSEGNPTKNGEFDVEIPASPIDRGASYLENSKYAKTWFRIGHSEGRFLHCGIESAGCVTVTDLERWTAIYRHLIIARKDLLNVGTLIVKD